MKISKKAREEAIEECLVRSEEWRRRDLSDANWMRYLSTAAHAAIVVAERPNLCVEGGNETVWLEAAALLRDGWNPGDPVEVRRG